MQNVLLGSSQKDILEVYFEQINYISMVTLWGKTSVLSVCILQMESSSWGVVFTNRPEKIHDISAFLKPLNVGKEIAVKCWKWNGNIAESEINELRNAGMIFEENTLACEMLNTALF